MNNKCDHKYPLLCRSWLIWECLGCLDRKTRFKWRKISKQRQVKNLTLHFVRDLLFAFATKDINAPISDFNKDGFKKIVDEFIANYKP